MLERGVLLRLYAQLLLQPGLRSGFEQESRRLVELGLQIGCRSS